MEEVKKRYCMEKIDSCKINLSGLYRLLNWLIGKNVFSAKLTSGHSLVILPEKFKVFFIDNIKKIYYSSSIIRNSKNSRMPDFPLLGFNQFKPVCEE